jgi:hypothetical protein
MNMGRTSGRALSSWFLLAMWCAPALADGGSVWLSTTKSGYRLTIFTAPTPLRAGPVDISVLAQDGSTGEPLLDARVTVRLHRPGEPALEYPATTEAATNKLLYAAQFELPAPGRWDMEVHFVGRHGSAVVGGELEAAEPLPRWLELWPWIGWPGLAVALFGIHQALARRGGTPRRDRISGEGGRGHGRPNAGQ